MASVIAAIAGLLSLGATVWVEWRRRKDEAQRLLQQRHDRLVHRRVDARVELYAKAFADLTYLEQQLHGAISKGFISQEDYEAVGKTHLTHVVSHAQVQLIGGVRVVETIDALSAALSDVTLALRQAGGSSSLPSGRSEEQQEAARAGMRRVQGGLREACRSAMRSELEGLVDGR